ncbi:MAG: class I SAM-dependent methyltransferase [Halobacteriovoraceae bacterium]|nr:class I SAM-dependent methyltransferase [Halobacteriovoraceae bacterium]MCB9093755.1 class I SAM-dependent methyltransferase [Halobacteriovoraceae bacterium]
MKNLILLFFIFSCTHGHHGHHDHQHNFGDVAKWEKRFESKKRDEWQEPQKVFKSVGLKPNSLVADIGAATGYFPIRIAKVVKKGRVWGVDVEASLVRYLNNRAQKEKINNLYSVLGTYSDPLIPEAVDFIFIVNTYHHIESRNAYFQNLRNYLKKDGKIVIIDFKKGDLPFGPKDDHKFSKEDIIKEMESASYKLSKSFDYLKYQNLLIFQ